MTEALVVIDLEATSRDPEQAHIVEWAAVVQMPPWFSTSGDGMVYTGLVKPPVAIPPETSAVHHIIDEDVQEFPAWEAQSPLLSMHLSPGRVAVAHNADYEKAVLGARGPLVQIPWLCTYKASLRVWPDAPSHSNEGLRYWLQLGGNRGRRWRQDQHSAAHDAVVTMLIVEELLRVGTSIADMIRWTGEPAMLPTCPLGDWRGFKWADVDGGFLEWIIRKIDDRPDVVFCAQAELERRLKARI